MKVHEGLITAEALEEMPPDEACVELVAGELVAMSPAGAQHGEIAVIIVAALFNHVRPRGLGKVYAAETGFVLSRNPDTVRAPDAAFVSAARARAGGSQGVL